jgi:hypothetical protein
LIEGDLDWNALRPYARACTIKRKIVRPQQNTAGWLHRHRRTLHPEIRRFRQLLWTSGKNNSFYKCISLGEYPSTFRDYESNQARPAPGQDWGTAFAR